MACDATKPGRSGGCSSAHVDPSVIVTGIEIAVKASDNCDRRHSRASGDAKLKQAVESITAAPRRRRTVTPPGSMRAYGGFFPTSRPRAASTERGQKTTVPVVRITGDRSQKRSRRRAPSELTNSCLYDIHSISSSEATICGSRRKSKCSLPENSTEDGDDMSEVLHSYEELALNHHRQRRRFELMSSL
ncbi:hypothetical protein MUK42_01841 [Musa troglodytarum]|uniref:Uncharacterized protein n=1 Tax=Musa troglodytarum TaxID=320322 RepID=A0A9E7JSW5_9LILI|nr:hypothetical protein MUK42_01841 [Musa troglodytarum]